jgi:hypothetical protein
MAANPIFVEPDEELPGVIEQIRRSAAEDLPLVLPARARFGQSRFNFQLLREYAGRLGKRVTIVSPDPAIQRMAHETGFIAVATVEQLGAAVGPPVSVSAPEPYQPRFTPEAPPQTPLGWSVDADPEPWPTVDPGQGQHLPPLLAPPAAQPPPDPGYGPEPPPGAWAPDPGYGHEPPPGAWAPDPGYGPEAPPWSEVAPRPRARYAPPSRAAGRAWAREMARALPGKMRLSIPTYLAAPDVRPGRLVFYGGAALLLLVGIIASVVYVPSAEVDMVAQAQPFSQNVSISGDPGKQPIPVRVASASSSANQSFTTTRKIAQAQVAKGTVTFDASGCGGLAFTIPNGTRLHYVPGNIGFATNGGDVSVGGNGNAPQAQTSIVATQAGQPGNVPAGPYVFDNPGQLGNCIQVQGSDTTGGADQSQKIVIQKSDLDAAKATLDQAVKQQITNQLAKQAQNGEKLLTDQIQWGANPDFQPNQKVGDAVGNFSASLSETATAYFYRPADVTRAFTGALRKNAPTGKVIAGSVTTTYQVAAGQNGHLTFSGKASGFLAPRLNSDAIRSQVAGQSPSAVKTSLKSRYPVQDVQIKQFPFGLPFMPLSASRVTVRYQILSGDGSGPSG